jgi:hypothetical protein
MVSALHAAPAVQGTGPGEGPADHDARADPCGTVVLLATHNGAAYLPEQLRSLALQTDADWRVLVRDDGSTDDTSRLIAAFQAEMGTARVTRIGHAGARLGALRNFTALLAAAPAARRYAFCDQDDVWLPGKLERAAMALDRQPPDCAALYCSRQIVVDARLRPLGMSPPLRRPPSLRNALVQNVASGCTIVMNRMARDAILAAAPPPGSNHDWWAYLVTTAVGGRVLFDPEPMMLYRQHGSNTLGAAPGAGIRALRALRRGPMPFMDLLMAHVGALLDHPLITAEARHILLRLSAMPEATLAGKFALVRQAGLYRQGVAEDIAMRAWITCWHVLREPELGRLGDGRSSTYGR